ncbi:uncharacterized protein LOC126569184 [Anopheles aquasalis]|uniref:uncharacterized protein LOC126569184 n=1 Tax=Anopheles aquasalis TaxID=42839 RepID=UPI00215AF116|nr:uncharacterized protein LOC126569184 [Anopheles aquasalis]
MENNRENRAPAHDEDPLIDQARRLLQNLSDNWVPHDADSRDDLDLYSPPSPLSELSFSSDSFESDICYVLPTGDADPIVELPSTPKKDAQRSRHPSQEQIVSPQVIGAVLEHTGTVLMQRSQDNRLPQQLREMQALMRTDEELLLVKQPSMRKMLSQPAFNSETIRRFLDHSETMFNLAHDASSVSGQMEDNREPESSSKRFRPKGKAADDATKPKDEDVVGNEFIGCFSRNNDMVMYKRTLVDRNPQPNEAETSDETRTSIDNIDTLIAQHAECLQEAETIKKPWVQICRTDEDNLLALLTFSAESSAILKTSNATLQQADTSGALDKAILQIYRDAISRPDEMISLQTEEMDGVSSKVKQQPDHRHAHKHREEAEHGNSPGSSSFGLVINDSQSGMVLQGSSKNWAMHPFASHAVDILKNIRLLAEEYILRGSESSVSVLRFVSRVISDIVHFECGDDVSLEFRSLSLIQKIKQIIDELLFPHGKESAPAMVRNIKHTLEEILCYEHQRRTIETPSEAWAIICDTFELVACELDHEIERPEVFLEALQLCLQEVVNPADYQGLLRGHSSALTRTVQQASGSTDLHKSTPSVASHCAAGCWMAWLLLIFYSLASWIRANLTQFVNFILRRPAAPACHSVSFRQTITEDSSSIVNELLVRREHLNHVVEILRVAVARSLSAMDDSQESSDNECSSDENCRSVGARTVELCTKLLQGAGNVQLQCSDSSNNIHLQLNSISGDLVKRHANEFDTVSGSVRDHEGNVVVLFEAQLVDIDSLDAVEPIIENVTRVERLSDYGAEISETTVEASTLQTAADQDVEENEMIADSVIEELVSEECMDNAGQQGTATTDVPLALPSDMLARLELAVQDLLKPLALLVHRMYSRLNLNEQSLEISNNDGTPATSIAEVENGIVELQKADQLSVPITEKLEEIRSLFHDANDRLSIIDNDVSAIKMQVNILLEERRRISVEGSGSQDDNQREKTRRSIKPRKNNSLPNGSRSTCCQTVAKHTPTSSHYCPVDIYSCHEVAPEVIVIHWTVDKDLLSCIGGYQIFVDDVLRSVCFSNKRRTALIGDIDLQQQHHIVLHATPDPLTKEAQVKWEPAFFLYHL